MKTEHFIFAVFTVLLAFLSGASAISYAQESKSTDLIFYREGKEVHRVVQEEPQPQAPPPTEYEDPFSQDDETYSEDSTAGEWEDTTPTGTTEWEEPSSEDAMLTTEEAVIEDTAAAPEEWTEQAEEPEQKTAAPEDGGGMMMLAIYAGGAIFIAVATVFFFLIRRKKKKAGGEDAPGGESAAPTGTAPLQKSERLEKALAAMNESEASET